MLVDVMRTSLLTFPITLFTFPLPWPGPAERGSGGVRGPNTCDLGTIPLDCPHLQQRLHGAAPLHIHDAIPNTSTDQWAPRRFVCIQTAGAYCTSISPQNNQTPQSSPRSVNSANARSKTAAGGRGRRSSRRHRRLIVVHFDVHLRALLARMNLEWGGGFTMQVREDEQRSWRCTFVPAAQRNPCLISWCKVFNSTFSFTSSVTWLIKVHYQNVGQFDTH